LCANHQLLPDDITSLPKILIFLWLYETLSANNPGVVVPPVPEKNTFGRFDDQFVKQRRLALEKCIQKIANHPVLMKDTDLRFFLESDNFALDVSKICLSKLNSMC